MSAGLKVGIAGTALVLCVLGSLWLAHTPEATVEAGSAQAGQAKRSEDGANVEVKADPTYVPDVVLVGVDEGLDEKQVATALTSFGVKTVDPSTVEFVTSGYVQIAVREGHTVEEAMDELADVDIVRTTQPDFIYRAN